jgi:hypothetical protein
MIFSHKRFKHPEGHGFLIGFWKDRWLRFAMRSTAEWLQSEEIGGPFRSCVECRLPLLEIDAPWLVNKDYFRNECVLEYAICKPCRDGIASKISEESKAAVRQFLESEVDWHSRVTEFMDMHDPCERFSACIACRKPRESLEGFAISALFDSGGYLTCGALPLLMCRECVSRMTSGLSDESRAIWKQFVDSHFSSAPGEGEEPFGELGIF